MLKWEPRACEARTVNIILCVIVVIVLVDDEQNNCKKTTMLVKQTNVSHVISRL